MRAAAICAAALALVASGCTKHRPSATATPLPLAAAAREGFDVARLRTAEHHLASTPELTSVLVSRHGRLVLERYYHGMTRDRDWSLYSVTKSVVSALVGIAIRERRIAGVDEKLVSVFPDDVRPDGDPRVRSITLRNLLTMSSGYRNENTPYESDDWVRTLLNRPIVTEPGKVFSYDDGSAHLLSTVLTQVTGESAADYARHVLFRPLGVKPGRWNSDGQGRSLGSGGLFLRPRDMLRFGQLYLQGGRWHGRQIVPRNWVRASTRRQISIPGGYAYGYLWWINTGRQRGYLAQGYRGQTIEVFPRLSLVIVLTGVGADPRPLIELLLDSIHG
jgi:CubicO group peptidase (beta-lactamase class C family)